MSIRCHECGNEISRHEWLENDGLCDECSSMNGDAVAEILSAITDAVAGKLNKLATDRDRWRRMALEEDAANGVIARSMSSGSDAYMRTLLKIRDLVTTGGAEDPCSIVAEVREVVEKAIEESTGQSNL